MQILKSVYSSDKGGIRIILCYYKCGSTLVLIQLLTFTLHIVIHYKQEIKDVDFNNFKGVKNICYKN